MSSNLLIGWLLSSSSSFDGMLITVDSSFFTRGCRENFFWSFLTNPCSHCPSCVCVAHTAVPCSDAGALICCWLHICLAIDSFPYTPSVNFLTLPLECNNNLFSRLLGLLGVVLRDWLDSFDCLTKFVYFIIIIIIFFFFYFAKILQCLFRFNFENCVSHFYLGLTLFYTFYGF